MISFFSATLLLMAVLVFFILLLMSGIVLIPKVILFNSSSFFGVDFGVERGIRLDGMNESQISKALEDLVNAGDALRA